MIPIEPTNGPLIADRPALAPHEGGENGQYRRAKRARANGATQIVPAYVRPETPRTGRVRLDGKFFAIGSQRFDMRGVTYGTFAPAPMARCFRNARA